MGTAPDFYKFAIPISIQNLQLGIMNSEKIENRCEHCCLETPAVLCLSHGESDACDTGPPAVGPSRASTLALSAGTQAASAPTFLYQLAR